MKYFHVVHKIPVMTFKLWPLPHQFGIKKWLLLFISPIRCDFKIASAEYSLLKETDDRNFYPEWPPTSSWVSRKAVSQKVLVFFSTLPPGKAIWSVNLIGIFLKYKKKISLVKLHYWVKRAILQHAWGFSYILPDSKPLSTLNFGEPFSNARCSPEFLDFLFLIFYGKLSKCSQIYFLYFQQKLIKNNLPKWDNYHLSHNLKIRKKYMALKEITLWYIVFGFFFRERKISRPNRRLSFPKTKAKKDR